MAAVRDLVERLDLNRDQVGRVHLGSELHCRKSGTKNIDVFLVNAYGEGGSLNPRRH